MTERKAEALTGQRTFILLNIDFSSSVPFPPPPIVDQIYPCYSVLRARKRRTR